MEYILFCLAAYLIGSVPFGLLLTKIFLKKDIRKEGSGNIGTTNVLRAGNKKLAATTLILDAAKGAIVVIAYSYASKPTGLNLNMYEENMFIHHVGNLNVGFWAIFGHCFPIWLKFKGGKGVATALGVLLAAVPYAGLAACATWLIVAKITKISSLSALIAVAIAPIVTFFIYGAAPSAICALITLLVWIRHKDNIKRIIKGEEPRIGAKKKEKSVEPVSNE